jgi:hypothetical protein
VPGAAEVVLAVEHDDVLDAEATQRNRGAHAAEPRADDDGLVDVAIGVGGHVVLLNSDTDGI